MYDEIVNDNTINLNQIVQNYTFQFDADKFISAMENLAESEEKINYVKDTVIDSVFNENELIKSLSLKDSGNINADYFISCIGQTAFNQNILREEYEDYSSILLTDKAIFYPLPYTNKQKEFSPYTTAKAMKYGWRWITPTWSRIGTGYAFSSKHTTVDEAIEEFREDVGDSTIEPFTTDFYPRRIKKVFKENHCSIGMAAGFLEPLDAPGLALTFQSIILLKNILINNLPLDFANHVSKKKYNDWASFILHQYKTSEKNNTQFWIDQKEVDFDHYNKIINDLSDPYNTDLKDLESYMFYHTSAGKGHRWETGTKLPPPQKKKLHEKSETVKSYMFDHFDFFNRLHDRFE